MTRRLAFLALAALACDPPRRTGSPAVRGDSLQEPAVPTAFDHAAAYRDFLQRMRIADPGDRVVDDLGQARGAVRCFALREGEGLRLKACVTPTGMVREGFRAGTNPRGVGDDWAGLMAAAPDAAAMAAWVAWLLSDDGPATHGPTIRRPTTVLAAGDPTIEPAHRAKVRAPELTKTADGGRFSAWFAKPGLTAPLRWTIATDAKQTTVTQTSAVELP